MKMFRFFVFYWKYPFGGKFVQKVKIVSLKLDSHLSNKNVNCLIESPLNMKKMLFISS